MVNGLKDWGILLAYNWDYDLKGRTGENFVVQETYISRSKVFIKQFSKSTTYLKQNYYNYIAIQANNISGAFTIMAVYIDGNMSKYVH